MCVHVFQKILEECSKRMGQDWRPNQALDLPLFLELLSVIEKRIEDSVTPEDENKWTVTHTFLFVSYVVSLRGPEGFLLDLEVLNDYKKKK